MIYLKLFLSFLKVGLFSFGGGYAAISLIQSQAVEKYGWLTLTEFTDLVSIAEMTPGPIAVNAATFIGLRLGGIGGALTATFACILPSCFIVTALFFIYKKYGNLPFIRKILVYIRPAAVALVASAGLTILINVIIGSKPFSVENMDITAAVLFVLSLFGLKKFKLNPIITMLMCGGIYLSLNLLFPVLGR